MRVACLVPIKAFADAKVRLAPALAADDRAALARSMAEKVLAAARPLTVAVACDDRGVAEWAEQRGAVVAWTPGRGLNGAVQDGVVFLRSLGAEQVIVAHADLPLATELSSLAWFSGVTLVPDRREDGTNVACIPADSDFRFAYGPGSFARHCAEARRLGLALHVTRVPELGWDVDVPADLDLLSV